MTAPASNPVRRGRRGPVPGSPRGPRLSKADRERQIVTIAERIFGEHGFANTTMEMVAEAAGITKPVIYDHFGSKEGLLTAVIEHARDDIKNTIVDAWQSVEDRKSPRASYRAGLVAFFTVMDQHRTGWRSLMRQGGIGSLAIDAAREAQTASVLLAMRQFPTLAALPQPLLEGAIEGLIGACERVSIWRAERDDVTPEMAADIVMGLTWYGVSSLIATPAH